MRSSLVCFGLWVGLVPLSLLAQQRPAPRPAQRPVAAAARAMAGSHREGSWELSAGAGVFGVGQAVSLTGKSEFMPGGMLRIGYHVNEMWSLSVGTGFGFGKSVYTNLTGYATPTAQLSWTPSINSGTAPFITAGAGLLYQKNPSNTAFGGLLGLGIRQFIGNNLALRIQGNLLVASLHNETTGAGLASFGLSYFAGGGPPKDSDGDGVPDKYDRCPNTPRGAVVDARGCPIDSDHDGVPDGIDRCPDTPSGVRVDAMGCPIDTDHDGVPDNLDRCPNTPSGVRVDANGCPVDSDSDGVPDYLDKCANTPRGAPVYADGAQAGCPKDSDSDGVPDYLDRCPNTPAGVQVDPNGCPIDSDHDGVPDYRDKCPNTAAGVPVDADGCPLERDTDGDGVPDSRDKCPNTPRGVKVDTDGCPLAELPATVNAHVVLRNVRFRANRAILLPAARTELDRVAVAIRMQPDAKWELQGYTSSIGSRARNLTLSRQRAEAVRQYLISRGVAAGNLTAVGYGPSNPVASNRTTRGRALNMRVEIKRIQ